MPERYIIGSPNWHIRKDEGRRSVLYLCVYNWPSDGELTLEGYWNPRRVSLFQNGKALKYSKKQGLLTVFVPKDSPEVSLPGTPVIIRLELGSKLPVDILSTNSEKNVGNHGLDG